MTDDLLERLTSPMVPYDPEVDAQGFWEDLCAEAKDRIEALTAERDNYKLCALHSRDVVEAAEAEIERLRDKIARLKSEDGYIQAFIEGQKAMPKGVFTIVDSPKLATLQADNARLRQLLTELLQVQDGVPMMGVEATRRGEAARAALTGKADT